MRIVFVGDPRQVFFGSAILFDVNLRDAPEQFRKHEIAVFRPLDLEIGRGAKNVDSECTGTTMRDYLRVTDLAPLPDEVIRLYDDETNVEGKLVYKAAPETAEQ